MTKQKPYVCQTEEIPGAWAEPWLLVTNHGTSAHRTRDGAYRALRQYEEYQCRKDES